ncbi:MAG: CaiB/BaiF CoA-transferase family protein [Acidimicrobiia bacterium]|jgi:alpha-methylacyl-CoA racemase
MSGGPLAGVRVLEITGLGPGPFCGMLLADLGAEVLRLERADVAAGTDHTRPATNAMHRGKRAVGIDLKHPDGAATFLRLCEAADAVIDVFRPGVAERLGIGPDDCRARNHRLVYGRLTGWGQDGPYAPMAGHDIDYIAISGALEPIGRAGQPPTPPLNVVGDFAGGGMLLAFGIVAALFEREHTGMGQVIDAAMIDGAALMMTPFFAARASGFWGERGTNILDTGAPYYEVYETADHQWMAVGAIEPQFYALLLEGLGLDPAALPDRDHPASWPALKERFAAVFVTRTRDEWCTVFDGTDACVAPVLSPVEAPEHPHNRARRGFLEHRGVPQPAPAPRFSTHPDPQPALPEHPGVDTGAVLGAWGIPPDDVAALRSAGVVV